MYFFKQFVEKYNIDNQLPDFIVLVEDSFLIIENIDYRLCVYGWPDNRVAMSNLMVGVNTIKRFGPKGRDKCEAYLKSCLEKFGVEFTEDEQ